MPFFTALVRLVSERVDRRRDRPPVVMDKVFRIPK